jgi:hypothetical protein
MKLPEGNIHWKEALKQVRANPGRFEICMTPSVFILEENSFPTAVIDWSSFDAREAQQALKRRAFARCVREDCGIRLRNDQEPREDCGNH